MFLVIEKKMSIRQPLLKWYNYRYCGHGPSLRKPPVVTFLVFRLEGDQLEFVRYLSACILMNF